MKKFIAIIVFSLILTAHAKSIGLQWNKKYSTGIIKINGIKFKLPDGEWLLVDKSGWTVNVVRYTNAIFVKEENNILKEIFEAGALDTGGKWIGHIDSWVQSNMFSKYNSDGCFKKPEYYLLKLKKTGSAFNCFIIHHDDVEKELWNPDQSSYGVYKPFNSSWVRKWILDKKINIPSTMLSSRSYFYDKNVGYFAALQTHSINPELYGAPKTKFRSEENSEYHKYNIEKYPNAKKFMDNFIKQSAYNHLEFQKLIKSKDNLSIDFEELNLKDKSNLKIDSESSTNKDIVEKIKELNELYKSGVLTKEEFTQLKKSLLN